MSEESLHPDASEIAERLKKEGISALYHFTSVENLSLIRKMGGLCSKNILEDSDLLEEVRLGGNDLSRQLDRERGNWNMVSLNYTPYTPMVYHKKPEEHLCFLEVDPRVALRAGVAFTDRNATANGCVRLEGVAGLQNVNFDAVRMNPEPWNEEGWKTPVQAEVLVPEKIGMKDILRICFVSQASLDEGQDMWGGTSHLFSVKPDLFSSMKSRKSPEFSYLKKILMTDQELDEQTERNLKDVRHCTSFHRESGKRAVVLSRFYAHAPAKVKITCKTFPLEKEEQVEQGGDYKWRCPVPIHGAVDGPHDIEYRINGVRWRTLKISISP